MSEDVVTFKTVKEFKTLFGATEMQVVLNSKTGKKSVLVDNQKFLKCQQDINTAKPMSFLIPNGMLDEACLVNVGSPLTTMVEL